MAVDLGRADSIEKLSLREMTDIKNKVRNSETSQPLANYDLAVSPLHDQIGLLRQQLG